MSDLLAARLQMAISLGFHIIFAVVGIGMPLLMVLAERKYQKTKDQVYYQLARRWAKGTAIMFAVGAVSGTALSFELGLLWPQFMAYAGPIIGMPFSLEGLAFFTEAIFLGIYMYGWDRIPPRAHLLAGIMVLISGAVSGMFVVTANAWMNTPTGFTLDAAGKLVDVDVFGAMFNPAAFTQVLHMTIAAFLTIGFAVAGIHAFMLLRDKKSEFHRKAIGLALPVGAIAAVLQVISGDISAKMVAKTQPIKLAAMEGQWETKKGAPLRLLGWPDEEAEKTTWDIEIPYVLSILAYGDPNAEVKGLKAFPKKHRPPVAIVHLAFQVMVGCGFAMLGIGLLGGFLRWRTKALPTNDWYLKLLVLATPMGFIAVEAGWVVTEVGRQPWIIHNIMLTKEAVTPMPGIWITCVLFTLLYLFLGVVVAFLLKRLVFHSPSSAEETGDDGPDAGGGGDADPADPADEGGPAQEAAA